MVLDVLSHLSHSNSCTAPSPVELVCPPELQEQAFQECRKLFGDAFKDCHMSVPPQIYVDSCVYDHCANSGLEQKICASLESYVAACEIRGVALGDWRKDTACGELFLQLKCIDEYLMSVSKLCMLEFPF